MRKEDHLLAEGQVKMYQLRRQELRESVAQMFRQKPEFADFNLYVRVVEPRAAALMGYDISTLKRARRRGDIRAVRDNGRIYYFGYQICDWYLNGMKDKWDGVERRSVEVPKG